MQYAILIVSIPLFWALLVRPQQQRQRKHLEMVASLVPGDRVEGFSGIHGTLIEVHDRTVRIEVADGVVLTMARLAVASRVDDDDLEDQVIPSDHALEPESGSIDGDEL